MKFSTVLRLMRFWPPFMGAGISVKSFSPDYTHIVVQMKSRFWNKNYVGTHFGGSLYAMTDPFYMLMILSIIGKGYIVWDKSASIRYRKPATGTVFATFAISKEQIEQYRLALKTEKKIEPEFLVQIKDKDGDLIAELTKVIHISKKK